MPAISSMRPSGAAFSRCQRYRYALWRAWEPQAGAVLFIGLNPSTADAERNDPTIRRCIGFARRWGYGAVLVANLFSYRATHPQDLRKASQPIGPGDDRWLRKCLARADATVVAWGNDGLWTNRHRRVLRRIEQPLCLGQTKQGAPRHPLYVRAATPPFPYEMEA